MKKNRKRKPGQKRVNARSGRLKLNVRAKSKRGTQVRRWAAGVRVAKVATAAALALLLVAGLWRAVDNFLFESPEFKLATIDYQSDGYLTRARVLDAAGIETGVNILRIDLEEVRDKVLAALPQVRAVEIVRDLPDRIAVTVVERDPVAWLGDIERPRHPQKRHGGWLIDSDGVVVECERLEPGFVELPIIYSTDFADAAPGLEIDSKPVLTGIDLIAAFETGFASSPVRLETLWVEGRHDLTGYLNTGAKITFGLKELPRQVDDLQVLLAEATRRGRALATANLQLRKNIPVRFASLPQPVTAPRALPVYAPSPQAEPAPAPAARRRKVFRSAPRPATSTRTSDADPAVRSILRVD